MFKSCIYKFLSCKFCFYYSLTNFYETNLYIHQITINVFREIILTFKCLAFKLNSHLLYLLYVHEYSMSPDSLTKTSDDRSKYTPWLRSRPPGKFYFIQRQTIRKKTDSALNTHLLSYWAKSTLKNILEAYRTDCKVS